MTHEQKWLTAFLDALFAVDSLLEVRPVNCDIEDILLHIPIRYGELLAVKNVLRLADSLQKQQICEEL